MDSVVYPIVPATGKSFYLLFAVIGVLVLVTVGVSLLIFASVRGARDATFTLSHTGLQLKGDVYGRTIPLASLRAQEARAVNLAAEDSLKPKWKTMGTGLPGYQAGWFRLKDGQKALVYLTERDCVVYLPTTEGYSILLSVAEPEKFVGDLRRFAGLR